MNHLSLAQKILDSKKPFVFFHTLCVTKDILQQAIDEGKSMDLDVCVDDAGKPYLGHSKEYYEKSGDPWDDTMPLWEAVDLISSAAIPVIVDCKHFNAWSYVEEVINRIGESRCLVHTFVSEFCFDYDRNSPDFISEWSPIEKLRLLKSKFPSVTTTASAKWLPNDLLVSDQYEGLLQNIRLMLKDNYVDTVCLNVPDKTFSDKSLQYFLEENIILHVGIDNIDTTRLSQVYIGETDDLRLASKED
jgi:hypothetical protein